MTDVCVLADRLGFTEGPVWLPDGRVAVGSISHGAVYWVDPEGDVTESVVVGGGANGLAVGPDGAVYVAQNGGAWDGSGPAEPGVQVVRDGRAEYLVTGLGAPNDLAFGPDGRLWVTDTVRDVGWPDTSGAVPGKVLAVDVASGAVEVVLDPAPVVVNGLGFAPAGDRLYLTATLSRELVEHPVRDGVLGEPTLRHRFATGHPDGLAVAADGAVWVALTSADRVDVLEPDGTVRTRHVLPSGSLPTNVCLSDGDERVLVSSSHFGAVVELLVRG